MKEAGEGMRNFAQSHTENDNLIFSLFHFQTMSILCGVEALSPSLVQPCDLGQGTASLRGGTVRMILLASLSLQALKSAKIGKLPCLFVQGKSSGSVVNFRPEIKLNLLIIHKVGNAALLLKLLKPVEISQNYEANQNKLVENN